jgi:hypothetical protein
MGEFMEVHAAPEVDKLHILYPSHSYDALALLSHVAGG